MNRGMRQLAAIVMFGTLVGGCIEPRIDKPLTPETEQRLRQELPEEASVRNPVDMIASATPQSYAFALDHVLRDPNVDAAIAAFVPPLGIQTRDVAEAIVRTNAAHPDKPLLAVLMGREGLPAGLAELHEAKIPGYIFPESAARALSAMWRYRTAQQQPHGAPAAFETGDGAVRRILDAAMKRGETKLREPDAIRVLEAYGIPVVTWRYVEAHASTKGLPSAVGEAAESVGYPVAVKAVSPSIVHKTDAGAVALDIGDRKAAEAAVRAMTTRIRQRMGEDVVIDGILVQQMAPPGRETIVGLTRTPGIGAMVMFGLGGVYVEVMRDVVLRLAPITDADARSMIRDVRMYRLLEGVRGEPRRDHAALEEVLLRVSQLAERHPGIAEMDINPLLALERGAVAVDARIQLAGP